MKYKIAASVAQWANSMLLHAYSHTGAVSSYANTNKTCL